MKKIILTFAVCLFANLATAQNLDELRKAGLDAYNAKNYTLAFKTWLKAANLGHITSQSDVGT